MQYPKFKYKKSDCAAGFEAVLVKSAEREALLQGEHFDSPAAFGIITHPNPEEVADAAAAQAAKPKKAKGA